MNDNDIYNAMLYKSKKLRQFNPEELSGVYEGGDLHRFRLLDEDTGEIYNYESVKNFRNGAFEDDD